MTWLRKSIFIGLLSHVPQSAVFGPIRLIDEAKAEGFIKFLKRRLRKSHGKGGAGALARGLELERNASSFCLFSDDSESMEQRVEADAHEEQARIVSDILREAVDEGWISSDVLINECAEDSEEGDVSSSRRRPDVKVYADRAEVSRALREEQVVSVTMNVHEDACVYFHLADGQQVKLMMDGTTETVSNSCSFFTPLRLLEVENLAQDFQSRVPTIAVSTADTGGFSTRRWCFFARNYFEMIKGGEWGFQ